MSKKIKDNYAAWSLNEKDFPDKGLIEDKIRFLMGYGILAPSTHNTQPWLFSVENNYLAITPDSSRLLKVGDPDSWGLFISIGACAENIVQAAEAFGLSTTVGSQENGLVVSFEKEKLKITDKGTLETIKGRCSDKLEYLSKKIPPTIIERLKSLSVSDIKIDIITDPTTLSKITENHIVAAKTVASDPNFAIELSNWLRLNNTNAYDGMPGFVIGNSNAKSRIGKFLLKKKPMLLQKLVKKDRQLFKSSAGVAIFSVKGSELSKTDMFESGRLIEKFWLELTKSDLVAHPMYASIQDLASRRQLAKILGTKHTPVFLMRIGYSKNKQLHTPRAGNIMAKSAITKLADTLKSHPQSHQVNIGKYKINYITAGQGKPVLLIHGANIGWPQWHLNLDALAKNFKVYAIDLPGAGESTKVNFRKTNFEKDYVDIVDQFVKKLKLKNIDVVGSSFGGWVAMRLAIENRDYIKRLVVTNPIGFTGYMPAKFRPVSIWPLALLMSKTALKPKRSNKNLEKFMRDVFYEKDRPLLNEFVDYFYELSKDSHNVLFISRLAHYSGMRKELFLGKRLKKINVPTLVIWGKEDPLMPYATVKDNFSNIKDVKVKILERVGHMPPVEAANEFNEQVIKFLRGGENGHV